MQVNGTLTSLNLNENFMGDAGAAAIEDALKVAPAVATSSSTTHSSNDCMQVNRTLTRLDLNHNAIDDEGTAAIAEALKACMLRLQLVWQLMHDDRLTEHSPFSISLTITSALMVQQ